MKTIKIFIIALSVLASGVLYAQDIKVNAKKSEIKWTGKKVTGEHTGFIKVKEGNLSFKEGNISNGSFIIDMNSITNTDMEDKEYNQKLVGHLKSDDFFGVEKFPTAKLHITNAKSFEKYQAEVEATITIKGITQPITFTVKQANKSYVATIVIDRSKFDVKYGSGSFFDNLGDNLIYDDFTLYVKLVVQNPNL